MCSIMGVQDDYTVRDMLEVLCGATEWAALIDRSADFRFAELRVRPGETAALNAVRKSDKLRYKLDDQVKTYACGLLPPRNVRWDAHPRDKVFIHLQLCWAGSSLEEEQQSKDKKKTENASSRQTLMGIYQSAPRIADGEQSVRLAVLILGDSAGLYRAGLRVEHQECARARPRRPRPSVGGHGDSVSSAAQDR